jgi:hypothetical protein
MGLLGLQSALGSIANALSPERHQASKLEPGEPDVSPIAPLNCMTSDRF